mmetsp:Transcript_56826/g.166330  ORF Transcript_56826/g.166330 Transcript_56826/m.166330 type:complete len:200 (+) Transcript_56826:1638-2237(+)
MLLRLRGLLCITLLVRLKPHAVDPNLVHVGLVLVLQCHPVPSKLLRFIIQAFQALFLFRLKARAFSSDLIHVALALVLQCHPVPSKLFQLACHALFLLRGPHSGQTLLLLPGLRDFLQEPRPLQSQVLGSRFELHTRLLDVNLPTLQLTPCIDILLEPGSKTLPSELKLLTCCLLPAVQLFLDLICAELLHVSSGDLSL